MPMNTTRFFFFQRELSPPTFSGRRGWKQSMVKLNHEGHRQATKQAEVLGRRHLNGNIAKKPEWLEARNSINLLHGNLQPLFLHWRQSCETLQVCWSHFSDTRQTFFKLVLSLSPLLGISPRSSLTHLPNIGVWANQNITCKKFKLKL